jgi:hypothetical protein
MIESIDGSNIEEADEEAEMSSSDEDPDVILLKELKDQMKIRGLLTDDLETVFENSFQTAKTKAT